MTVTVITFMVGNLGWSVIRELLQRSIPVTIMTLAKYLIPAQIVIHVKKCTVQRNNTNAVGVVRTSGRAQNYYFIRETTQKKSPTNVSIVGRVS